MEIVRICPIITESGEGGIWFKFQETRNKPPAASRQPPAASRQDDDVFRSSCVNYFLKIL
jgi:hypothetical protein